MRRILVLPLLASLAVAGTPGETVTWLETPTHRVKVKSFRGREVGRWEFPREAPDPTFGAWSPGDSEAASALRAAFEEAFQGWRSAVNAGEPSHVTDAIQRRYRALALGFWKVAGPGPLAEQTVMKNLVSACFVKSQCGAAADKAAYHLLVKGGEPMVRGLSRQPPGGMVSWARRQLGIVPGTSAGGTAPAPSKRPAPRRTAVKAAPKPKPKPKASSGGGGRPAPRPAARPAVHASKPRCGPWKPGNGNVDRALWRQFESASASFRAGFGKPGSEDRERVLQAVSIGLWAVGGQDLLTRDNNALAALNCYRSGNPCGVEPDQAVAGAGRAYVMAEIRGYAGKGSGKPRLRSAVPAYPAAAAVRWARGEMGCGSGTATVAAAPAAAHQLGVRVPKAAPKARPAARRVVSSKPRDESWRLGQGKSQVEKAVNDMAREWGRKPGQNSLRYPARQAFWGNGKRTTEKALRAMGAVLARGGSYAEAAQAGSYSGAALACLFAQAAANGKKVPGGYLGAALPYLDRSLQGRIRSAGMAQPQQAARPGPGPAAAPWRPTYGSKPVTENSETRRSEAVMKQRLYEQELDRRIYGTRR